MSENNQHETNASAYGRFHRRVLEGRGLVFALATTVAISVGGLVEIVPMFTASFGPERSAAVTPYTPLEVAGRDLYMREGCMLCHSQMVRPMRSELLRYGEWSRAWEYTYDRPFLLGSRRLGPDLHRVGGKYPDAWHYEHMADPRAIAPGSIMPKYSWMLEWEVDPADITASIRALARAGHPYDDTSQEWVTAEMESQGRRIVENLQAAGIETTWNKEIIAMIAYLQRLGTEGTEIINNRMTAEEEGETEGAARVAQSPAGTDQADGSDQEDDQ